MDAPVTWKEALDKRFPQLVLAGIAVCGVAFYLTEFVIPNHPSRPDNVPKSATLVFGGFTHFWHECWYDSAKHLDECRIYNAGRVILQDDVYLPANGGAAISEDQLKIVQGSNPESAVHLSNGTVLIPQKNFDGIKKDLDGGLSESR
jgi:hypothetical protein